MTAGFRRDHGKANEDTYAKLSPRIALVQHLNSQWNIKLLYGEALRGPSIKEIGVNHEVKIEHPAILTNALAPEKIKTIEIAPYFHNERYLASATFFRTLTNDYLARNWQSTGEYINLTGSAKTTGYELALKYFINPNTRVFANYSVASTTDFKGKKLNDVPDKKANAGLLWNKWGTQAVSGSLVARWINAYTVANPTMPKADGHTIVDVNIDYQVDDKFFIGMQVKNIFDSSSHYPLEGKENLKMPGRTFLISLTYNYSNE